MMQSGTFCQKKAILQFLEENGSKVCKMSSCGEERPPKVENGEKMAHVAKFVLLLPTSSNRKQSRRIEENRGESRRIEENRGESRKTEENKKMRGNGREKRQRGKKKAVFDILAGFVRQFSPISQFFRSFPLILHIFTHFLRRFPLSAFFTFFPSFSANVCCLPLFFHPFSAEFLKRSPSFRPVFPIFHPISPKNKRSLPERKNVNNIFQEIVPGFSGDFVYVLFHPQNERTPRARKHMFATHPIR